MAAKRKSMAEAFEERIAAEPEPVVPAEPPDRQLRTAADRARASVAAETMRGVRAQLDAAAARGESGAILRVRSAAAAEVAENLRGQGLIASVIAYRDDGTADVLATWRAGTAAEVGNG